MKLKYLAFPLLFAAALATGCQESAEYEPVVYMTDAQSVPSMSVTIDELPASTAVSVTASEKAAHDLEVTLELRPDLVESYNLKYGKNYQPLPEGSYEFLNNKVVISAGFTTSSMADFTVTSMDDFAEGATYCMPVSIQSVNGSIGILEPSRTVYIVFKTPVVSKAIMLGSGNVYKIPSFQETSSLAEMPQLTLEARVFMERFASSDPYISSIMGIEGMCGVRFGDVKIDPNVLQICHDSYQPAATDKPFDTNKWYHVAAVWTGSSWDIYIDGQYATGTPTQGEMMNLTSDNSGGFYLGASYGGGRYLYGYIAEARVWSRALSQNEIANNMNYVDRRRRAWWPTGA